MQRLRHLVAAGTTLVIVLAGMLAFAQAPANADTLPSADTVFQDWNNAFLIPNGSGSYGGYGTAGTYYTDHYASTNTERAGTWIAGLDIAVAEDDYARTQSAADYSLVNNLVATQLADDGTDWTSWDGWNDDIGWMTNSTLRGYQITGNTAWLNVAETQWNNAYNRGWSGDGGGGIWENDTYYSKCALSNDPFVWEGAWLYKITGDSSYLTKAEQIYSWVKNTLVESSGQVNGCIAFPNGTGGGTVMQGSDNAYDAGGFIEAADALYRATQNSGYEADAETTADHFLNNIPIPSNNASTNGSERGNAYQYWLFKGMADYCTDAGNCAKYAGYIAANAAKAWSERNSDNVTWNDWDDPTNDPNPDAFEMTGMVSVFEALATTGTGGGSAATGGGASAVGPGPMKSGSSGKCLDDFGGSGADGTIVDLWDCNGTGAQNWTAETDGTLRINGKCLDAYGAGTGNGTPLDLWDCNGGGNQVWVAFNGGYKNPVSGRCLDDPNFSTTDGTQLELWDCNGGSNQIWSPPGQ